LFQRICRVTCSRNPLTRILLASNSCWSLVNFRAGLIAALVARGDEVIAAAPRDDYANRLAALGCRHVALPVDARGTSPTRDLALFAAFLRVMVRARPTLAIHYTIKPNIYGGLAGRLLAVPTINVVTGLGTVFIDRTRLTALVERLYRAAFRRARRVFFLNDDDLRTFRALGLVAEGSGAVLPSEGIDLAAFHPMPESATDDGGMHFLFVGRLLREKGVAEFARAAEIVRRRMPAARFRLLGFHDPTNPSAVAREDIDRWLADGTIAKAGATHDVRPHIAAADCVVLPSWYREGTPRSLLEAAAMGRPVITTDTPGCRDAVEDGVSGYLCAPRDAASLAGRMLALAALTPAERAAMGAAGRARMERLFDEWIVIERMLAAVDAILAPGNGGLSRLSAWRRGRSTR